MSDSSPPLSVDEIIRRVHSEVERRRGVPSLAAAAGTQAPLSPSAISDIGDYQRPTPPLIPAKDRYSLSEFLRFDDEAFIWAAYRGLLRRDPDPKGLETYLDSLRSGDTTKRDILIGIRRSPEGEACGVEVADLNRGRRAERIARIPVVGPFLVWLAALLRLPSIYREIRRIDADAQEVRSSWNAQKALGGTHESRAALVSLVARIESDLAELRRGVADLDRRTVATFGDHETRLERQEAENRERQEAPAALQRRLMALLEARLARDLDTDRTSSHSKPFPDALHLAFENGFRGDFDFVRARLSRYLPEIERATAAVGSKAVLDLGCGRGEWLDLSSAAGFDPLGIDANPAMVASCAARGLRAVEGDVLTELLRSQDNSFAAVSMFHVVEHLSFEVIAAVLGEVLRVLKPGGIAIIETPNPRNILVGAADFYRDPTRHRPVFPDTLAWLGGIKGFKDSRTWFIDHDRGRFLPAEEWHFVSVDDYVSVGRDFAWIGRK